jgi:hypothetical protein
MMDAEFEEAVAEPASPGKIERVVRRARRAATVPELDVKRASTVRVGNRQWAFVLTREAVDAWDSLGSRDLTVGVLIYEQPGAAAPFVQRELVVRPGTDRLTVEVREDGLPRWTGEGFVDRGGALDFRVPVDRDNAPRAGVMAGQVTREGVLRFTESLLPRPVNSRQPRLISEDKA